MFDVANLKVFVDLLGQAWKNFLKIIKHFLAQYYCKTIFQPILFVFA